MVTHIVGLDHFPDIKLKQACKDLGKRCAGSTAIKDTATGEKEIQVQGDWTTEITEIMEALFQIGADKVCCRRDHDFLLTCLSTHHIHALAAIGFHRSR